MFNILNMFGSLEDLYEVFYLTDNEDYVLFLCKNEPYYSMKLALDTFKELGFKLSDEPFLEGDLTKAIPRIGWESGYSLGEVNLFLAAIGKGFWDGKGPKLLRVPEKIVKDADLRGVEDVMFARIKREHLLTNIGITRNDE
jgi:hypothetical protein